MSYIGWGKCRIFVKDLDTTGAKYRELPTPIEGSTSLEATKGDKQEAKIEGGQNAPCFFFVFFRLADENFVQDAFCKELMIYILHYKEDKFLSLAAIVVFSFIKQSSF